MTEQEWEAATDPKPMLMFMNDKGSDRKLRLFAVSCCRRVWRLIPDESCQQAVDVAEQFADEKVTERELRDAATRAFASADANSTCDEGESFAAAQSAYFAARTAWHATKALAHEGAVGAASTCHCAAVGAAGDPDTNLEARISVSNDARQHGARVLRDIFGNPFRPVVIETSWITPDVRTLAEGIYAEKAFDRLPILADALMDAGCANTDLLNHLRSNGPHVKGCWALDLLTGRK